MIYHITAFVLIFGYTAAQDADCDFYQDVKVNEQYYIYNPEYPNNYRAGRSCRFRATCPNGYNCRVECTIELPSSPNCVADRMLVSRAGDPQLASAESYCGYGTFTAVSDGRVLIIGTVAPTSSKGGRFLCTLTAQQVPTPAPPACRCGETKQTRIVGGQETKVNEYPMMCALIERSTRLLRCGCVVISDYHVLTAGHCVYGLRPQQLQVVVARHYIENENSGREYNISRITVHNNYNPRNYDYDVAVIRVQGVFLPSNNVQPVCLPFDYVYSNITGLALTVLGWGTTQFGGPTSETLQKVELTVISQQTCARAYPNITNRQICTYTPDKDACQFDSGGPAMLTDNRGLQILFGVISNGDGCAKVNQPGIFTSVRALLQWIVSNTDAVLCRR